MRKTFHLQVIILGFMLPSIPLEEAVLNTGNLRVVEIFFMMMS